jgi:ribulose bisphosphate carboxylase small subunit
VEVSDQEYINLIELDLVEERESVQTIVSRMYPVNNSVRYVTPIAAAA